jgi:hypothetical protein
MPRETATPGPPAPRRIWGSTRCSACSTPASRTGTCSTTWPTSAVVGVNPSTSYQNMAQLLDAMKAKPGEIKVATAGVTSSGHNAMEADRARHRDRVPPCHLRRRQPRRGRHRVRARPMSPRSWRSSRPR